MSVPGVCDSLGDCKKCSWNSWKTVLLEQFYCSNSSTRNNKASLSLLFLVEVGPNGMPRLAFEVEFAVRLQVFHSLIRPFLI